VRLGYFGAWALILVYEHVSWAELGLAWLQN
jgi:hypothetical protein